MPKYCVVIGCSKNCIKIGEKVSFHAFPNEISRREVWIRAIGRPDKKGLQWEPSNHSLLCSKHFISGKPSYDPLNPDFVPSIFVPQPLSENHSSKKRKRITQDYISCDHNEDINGESRSFNFSVGVKVEEKPSDRQANPDFWSSIFVQQIQKESSLSENKNKINQTSVSTINNDDQPVTEVKIDGLLTNVLKSQVSTVHRVPYPSSLKHIDVTPDACYTSTSNEMRTINKRKMNVPKKAILENDSWDNGYGDGYLLIKPTTQEKRAGQKLEQRFFCNVCGGGFTQLQSLRRHTRTHVGEGEKRYFCEVCGNGFTQSGSLKRHMRIHSGERPFKCEECDATFIDQGHLQRHMKTHSGEDPFTCIYCGLGFPCSESLDRHLLTHTGERPFTCSLCDKGFITSGSLNSHKRTHLNKERKAHAKWLIEKEIDKKVIRKGEMYECQDCGRLFGRKHDLKTHFLTHSETLSKPFKCLQCDAMFSEVKDLVKHELIHSGSRNFECHICGDKFARADSLAAHHRKHTGERPFQCQLCSDNFYRSSDLKRHIKISHPDSVRKHIKTVNLESYTAELNVNKTFTDTPADTISQIVSHHSDIKSRNYDNT